MTTRQEFGCAAVGAFGGAVLACAWGWRAITIGGPLMVATVALTGTAALVFLALAGHFAWTASTPQSSRQRIARDNAKSTADFLNHK